MILTLSSQLAQCTVKIAATAEGEGEGWQSLREGVVDTRGPAGRTVKHAQLPGGHETSTHSKEDTARRANIDQSSW